MKRHDLSMVASLCAVVALSFVLTGCYESAVPMKEKGDKFAPELLGRWIEVTADGKALDPLKGNTPSEIDIVQGGAEEYAIRHVNSVGEVSHFRAFIVMVGDAPFLNAQVTEGDPEMIGKYFFFRYELTEGRLTLRMVSDRFIKEQYGTSGELYSFISTHLDDPKMYEEGVVFAPQQAK